MHNNISKYISEENIQFIIDNLILPKYINSIEFSTNTQQQYFTKIPTLHNSTILYIKLQYFCNHKNKSILNLQYSFTIGSQKNDNSTSYHLICVLCDILQNGSQITVKQGDFHSYKDLPNYINDNATKYILKYKLEEIKEIKNILLKNKIKIF